MLGRASRLTASIKPLFRNYALDDAGCPAFIIRVSLSLVLFLMNTKENRIDIAVTQEIQYFDGD